MHTSRHPVTIFAAALLSTVALFATACGSNGGDGRDDDGRLRVVATTAQIGALVHEVGGDKVSITTLIGPGVDPHDYELTSDARKAVDASAVILRNGVGLDDFLDDVLEDGDNEKKLTTVSDGASLRDAQEALEGHSADDGHDHGDEDPHIWHDIDNVKVMVHHIADALQAADAANAATYRANADAYLAVLDRTDMEIRALIETIPAANRKVVTNHDAFGYFLDRYGLEFIGAVIPGTSTQAEPSAKDIAAIVELIRSEGVKAIFSESSVDPKVAAEIAKDTNVRIVDDLYGDSLGEPGSDAATVHGMLLANARTITEALK